jgi:hypothetical protein
MEDIEKALGALDVAEDITHIRAARKQAVDCFYSLIFVHEGRVHEFPHVC